MIGLFAAALGLIGSVVVARVNNSNTQQVEHNRAQSTLVLEAIKTGSPDSACKNLSFFLGLGLLDDTNHTIAKRCGSAPTGAPSLPAATATTSDKRLTVSGQVVDVDQAPIVGATIRCTCLPGGQFITDSLGQFSIPAAGAQGDLITLAIEAPQVISMTETLRLGLGLTYLPIVMRRLK